MPYDALYHAEPVAEDGWTGIRILTSSNTVHTALDDGGTEARLYGEPGDWTIKTRTPVEDEGAAYETFRAVADTLEERYDTTVEMDGFTFHEELDGPPVTRQEDGFTLRYNPEGEHPAPEHTCSGLPTKTALGAGFYSGGFIGLGEAAVLGGSIDPLLGMAVSFGSWVGLTAAAGGVNYAVPKGVEAVKNWRSERRYGDPAAIEERGLLAKVNRRNALEDYMREVTLETELGEAYDTLAEEDLDDQLDALLTGHFDRFHRQQGVAFTAETASYTAATDLLDAVTGTAYDRERPAVTRNRDAFRSMFDHTVFDGTVIDRGERLVERAVTAETDPAIKDFLESRHPDLTRDVAARTALERGD